MGTTEIQGVVVPEIRNRCFKNKARIIQLIRALFIRVILLVRSAIGLAKTAGSYYIILNESMNFVVKLPLLKSSCFMSC